MNVTSLLIRHRVIVRKEDRGPHVGETLDPQKDQVRKVLDTRAIEVRCDLNGAYLSTKVNAEEHPQLAEALDGFVRELEAVVRVQTGIPTHG